MAPEKKNSEGKQKLTKILSELGHLNANPLLKVNFSGKVTYWSKSAFKILKELGIQEPNSFVPKDLEDIVNTIRQGKETWFYREIRLGNRVFGEDIHGNKSGKVVHIYGIDITALKKVEKARDNLAAIVESSDDAIISKTLDGKITSWNRGASKIYGYTAQEVLGQSISILIPPDRQDEVPELLQKISRGERVDDFATTHRRKDCQQINVSLTISPIKDAEGEGKITGSSTIARDTTKRKRVEEALKQAHDELEQRVKDRTAELRLIVAQLREEVTDRLQTEEALKKSEARLRHLSSHLLHAQERERKRLAAELHDELGHALLTVKLQLRALERGLTPAQKKLAEDIETLQSFIDGVLGNVRRLYFDLSPGNLEDLGLTGALRQMLDEFAKHHKNISWQIRLDNLDREFPPLTQTAIYRIVQEILTNIGKHARPSQVSVRVKRNPTAALFTVEDNGCGFDTSQIHFLDDPNQGLGLAAMEERVRMQGGTLEIISRENQGTRIAFTLPLGSGRK
jgi:PAS domain S-box-containing protein